jgi:hypothetical protein
VRRIATRLRECLERIDAALASTPAPDLLTRAEASPMFACGRCSECDGGSGSDFCLAPRGGR